MFVSDLFSDYFLLDCGKGRRLEKWGKYKLIRPDPQAIWEEADKSLWKNADAVYTRSSEGGGSWQVKSLPESWQVNCDDMVLNVRPMSFKHTGVFPEQASNWDFIRRKIRQSGRNVSVLNLFAYTGGATVAAAKEGACVCHVDASRGMVSWAKENAMSNGLSDAPVRYIVDDARKFIKREINRGRRYDAVIMDPPSYGRGPSGEIWKFEENVSELIELCASLLSDDPLFFLISSYTSGIAPSVPAYILGNALRRFGGRVDAQELGLKVQSTGLYLPCGASARWEK